MSDLTQKLNVRAKTKAKTREPIRRSCFECHGRYRLHIDFYLKLVTIIKSLRHLVTRFSRPVSHKAKFPSNIAKNITILFLLISNSTVALPAKNELVIAPKLHLANYSINDGLSLNSVTSFAQTIDGFMWIGSEDGLNRFDGYEFKIYKRIVGDFNSLPDNMINSLFVDSRSRLWVGTQRGLAAYDQEFDIFKRVTTQEKNTGLVITAMVEDIYGRLWVLGNDELFVFDEESQSLVPFSQAINAQQPFMAKGLSGLHTIGPNLYFGKNDCLITLDLVNLNFKENCFGKNQLGNQYSVRTVTSNGRDNIWIGTPYGAIKYNLLTQEYLIYHANAEPELTISHDLVQSIFVDSSDTVWVATANGLNRFNANTEKFIQYHQNLVDDEGLLSGDILAVYEDADGLLWIATYGSGLHIWNRQTEQFGHFLTRQEASQFGITNTVHSIATDLLDNLWIGSYGDGLFKVNPERNKIERIHAEGTTRKLSDFLITALHFDIYDNLWIATNHGLYALNVDTNRLHKLPNIDGFVSALTEDRNGELWIGMFSELYNISGINGRITQESNVKVTAYNHHFKELFGDDKFTITSIYESIQGLIWVGTEKGLLLFEPGDELKFLASFTSDESNSKSISSNFIQVIYEDTQGVIWVGTADGLNKIEYDHNQPSNSYFIQYTEKEGLINDSIYGIHSGHDEILWLSTNFGVLSLNTSSGEVFHYSVKDGLQSNEFNIWASHKSARGEVYFGGVNGVTSFNPETLLKTPVKPKLKVIEVKLNGAVVKNLALTDSTLTIQNESDLLTVKVASLNFYEPNKVNYRYKIVGASNAWYDIGETRVINIFGLNSGLYSIEVQASNKTGEWIPLEQPIEIEVQSVFWRSTMAIMLYAVLFVGLLIGAFYYWFRRVNLKTMYIKGELDKNRQYIKQLQLDIEKTKESEEYKQQEIMRLNERLDYFRQKFEQYVKRDKTTELFKRKFFEALINREDDYLKKHQAPFPPGCVITIAINNYQKLLKTEFHANIEAAVSELAELIRDFTSGDDLICRWSEDSFMMLESGSFEQLELKLYNFYRILKNRTYNCGNGRLIQFEFTLSIVPTPLSTHRSNLINRSLVLYLSADLIDFLKQHYQPGAFVFRCIDDCHPVELERRVSEGVEQLLKQNRFELIPLAKKLVKESA